MVRVGEGKGGLGGKVGREGGGWENVNLWKRQGGRGLGWIRGCV